MGDQNAAKGKDVPAGAVSAGIGAEVRSLALAASNSFGKPAVCFRSAGLLRCALLGFGFCLFTVSVARRSNCFFDALAFFLLASVARRVREPATFFGARLMMSSFYLIWLVRMRSPEAHML